MYLGILVSPYPRINMFLYPCNLHPCIIVTVSLYLFFLVSLYPCIFISELRCIHVFLFSLCIYICILVFMYLCIYLSLQTCISPYPCIHVTLNIFISVSLYPCNPNPCIHVSMYACTTVSLHPNRFVSPYPNFHVSLYLVFLYQVCEGDK